MDVALFNMKIGNLICGTGVKQENDTPLLNYEENNICASISCPRKKNTEN